VNNYILSNAYVVTNTTREYPKYLRIKNHSRKNNLLDSIDITSDDGVIPF